MAPQTVDEAALREHETSLRKSPPYFTLEFNAGLVKIEWTTPERAEQGKKVVSIEVAHI